MHLRSVLISSMLAATTLSAMASDDGDGAMLDRYRGLERCMDHTLGKGWQERYRVPMTLNRWGALAPNQQEIDRAPQAVRLIALRCERESGVDGSAGK